MPIHDVTVPMHRDMPTYPSDPPLKFQFIRKLARGAESNNSWMALGSHTGTHIDAPLHFIEGGGTVDRIPPDALVGPCRVVDAGEAPVITRAVLEGLDLAGAERLLFRTTNSAWITREFRDGFVAFTEDAARYLAEAVRPVLVGIDAPALDPLGTPGHPAHMAILGSETIQGAIEWLALADVAPGDYHLFCGPMCLAGAEAAPCRVFLSRD
ncbi:MAG: cyclase family protein [Phycisphaerae bacterium]